MKAIVALALLAAALLLFHDTLIIAFGGLLTAVLLNACTGALLRHLPLPRWAALSLVIGITGCAAAAAVAYGGNLFTRQYAALQVALPIAVQQAIQTVQTGPLGGFFAANAASAQSMAGGALSLAQRASGMISSTLALVLSIGVMAFVGICIAAEPDLYRRGFLALIPTKQRAKAGALLDAVGGALRAWLVARLISMFAIAIMSGIGLTMLHIPYAVALAALAGLLAFVPNVGAFVAGIPSVLLALAISPQRAGLVILMYWLAHALDDFLLIPIAERRIVHLPPALTILVQIGLGGLLGILGITFAAPLTATAIVTIRALQADDADANQRLTA